MFFIILYCFENFSFLQERINSVVDVVEGFNRLPNICVHRLFDLQSRIHRVWSSGAAQFWKELLLATDVSSGSHLQVLQRESSQNIRRQQQFFSELLSPWWSCCTNYWSSWVQTIYYVVKYLRSKISFDLEFNKWEWNKNLCILDERCQLLRKSSENPLWRSGNKIYMQVILWIIFERILVVDQLTYFTTERRSFYLYWRDRLIISSAACWVFLFSVVFSELFGLELTTIYSEAFKDVTVTWDL